MNIANAAKWQLGHERSLQKECVKDDVIKNACKSVVKININHLQCNNKKG